MVSHGATGVATDGTTWLGKGRADLPPALQRRTALFDRDGKTRRDVNRLFRSIASAVGVDPDHVDVIDDPLVGPQRHVFDLPRPVGRPGPTCSLYTARPITCYSA